MYNEFYGFSENPFELTPNPKFLYLTPSHKEALASLIDGIKNRRRFISFTGEGGIGKTILVYSLLNSLPVYVHLKAADHKIRLHAL